MKFFRHPGYIINFTKGPCKRMNMKEVEALGLGGLAIVGPEYDEEAQIEATSRHTQHSRRRAPGHRDHKEGDSPQECRKVLTALKVSMHKRYKQLDSPHKTIENLRVAIHNATRTLKRLTIGTRMKKQRTTAT